MRGSALLLVCGGTGLQVHWLQVHLSLNRHAKLFDGQLAATCHCVHILERLVFKYSILRSAKQAEAVQTLQVDQHTIGKCNSRQSFEQKACQPSWLVRGFSGS